MKRYLLPALLMVLLCFACKPSAEKGKNPKPTKVENPTSQSDIEENAIVEYINANNLDCSRMTNGVYVCSLVEGSGAPIKPGGPVSAHYKGYTLDGKEFDSSYKRNKPLSFNVGQMISGWNEWLVTVKEGTKATLLIPSAKAYGSRAKGPIAANSTLAFDVEVLNPTK